MKKAVTDIGSNTVRIVIYHQKNGEFEKLVSQKKRLGLINYIEDDILIQEGIDCLIEVLLKYQKLAKDLDVSETYYFATEALRNIKNRDEVISYIYRELDIYIDVISNQDEGLLDFYGMRKMIQIDSGVMIDIGGGSSEIVHFYKNEIIQNQSFPIGSLNLYKENVKGIIPTTKELNQMNNYIKEQFKNLDTSLESTHAIGIGGTLRATIQIARIILKKNNIQDTITKEEILYLITQLTQNSKKTMQTILKVKPDRIHTIIPGLIILKELIDELKIHDIKISYTGAREGYFSKKILKEK